MYSYGYTFIIYKNIVLELCVQQTVMNSFNSTDPRSSMLRYIFVTKIYINWWS